MNRKRSRIGGPLLKSKRERKLGHVDTSSIHHEVVSQAEIDAFPSDEEVVLQMLRENCIVIGNTIPIILPSQVYSVLSDRSKADATIDLLVESRTLRRVKFGNSRSECLVFTEDLSALVDRLVSCLPDTGYRDTRLGSLTKQQCLSVAEVFNKRILPRHIGTSLRMHELHSALTNTDCSPVVDLFSSAVHHSSPNIFTPKHNHESEPLTSPDCLSRVDLAPAVALLHSMGLICNPVDAVSECPSLPADKVVHFATPNVGTMSRMVVDGRRELLVAIGRRKIKEMLEMDVTRLRMRRSSLGPLFHLRDCLGLDLVRRREGPLGALIQLTSAHTTTNDSD